MTSSKMSTTPLAAVHSRTRCRNPARRLETAGVDRGGLHDHRGDFARSSSAASAIDVAPVEHDDMAQRVGILAGGRRAVVLRLGGEVDRVGPPVIVAAELDDGAGGPSRARASAQRDLARFRASRYERAHLRAGHESTRCARRDPLRRRDHRADAQSQRHRRAHRVETTCGLWPRISGPYPIA